MISNCRTISYLACLFVNCCQMILHDCYWHCSWALSFAYCTTDCKLFHSIWITSLFCWSTLYCCLCIVNIYIQVLLKVAWQNTWHCAFDLVHWLCIIYHYIVYRLLIAACLLCRYFQLWYGISKHNTDLGRH